jgi:hypothetical protein
MLFHCPSFRTDMTVFAKRIYILQIFEQKRRQISIIQVTGLNYNQKRGEIN